MKFGLWKIRIAKTANSWYDDMGSPLEEEVTMTGSVWDSPGTISLEDAADDRHMETWLLQQKMRGCVPRTPTINWWTPALLFAIVVTFIIACFHPAVQPFVGAALRGLSRLHS